MSNERINLQKAQDDELLKMLHETQQLVKSRVWMWIDDYCNAYDEAIDLRDAISEELKARDIEHSILNEKAR